MRCVQFARSLVTGLWAFQGGTQLKTLLHDLYQSPYIVLAMYQALQISAFMERRFMVCGIRDTKYPESAAAGRTCREMHDNAFHA